MTLKKLCNKAKDKTVFTQLVDYFDFAKEFLEFLPKNHQAKIISRNENHYCFYQFKAEANFQITRPVNQNLMMDYEELSSFFPEWVTRLRDSKSIKSTPKKIRRKITQIVYTLQQSIGVTLDALPAGTSNTARKINGDLFERLIRLILQEMGLATSSKVIQVPVREKSETLFSMSYQHDLVVEKEGNTRLIGSIKTSSKDRLDKIFIDKFMYGKLTETDIPHIAIFLNDVQRKKNRKENEYGINSTFLPGHFKGYTVKLNPLDGVYYCDIRPNMTEDEFLRNHIRTLDFLLCDDLWEFLCEK